MMTVVTNRIASQMNVPGALRTYRHTAVDAVRTTMATVYRRAPGDSSPCAASLTGLRADPVTALAGLDAADAAGY